MPDGGADVAAAAGGGMCTTGAVVPNMLSRCHQVQMQDLFIFVPSGQRAEL